MLWLVATLGCPTVPVESTPPVAVVKAPPLVVLIVVDQLPIRTIEQVMPLATGGLHRLAEGYRSVARYPYVPTETCPGHAAISTGAAPDRSGIAANAWWNGAEMVYCVSPEGDARLLMAEALSDRVVAAGGRAVAFSLKDRAAIMLGGHTPTATGWLDYAATKELRGKGLEPLGELPDWKVDGERTWPVLDAVHAETYAKWFPDDQPFEPKEKRLFPHVSEGNNVRSFMTSPDAGKWLVDLAITATDTLKLGQGTAAPPDLLAISFSHIDVIGHTYTPDSWEMVDGLLRLDLELARLFDHLDQVVGKGAYTVLLTADHGAAPGGAQPLSEDKVIDAMATAGIPKEAKWSTGDPWLWLPDDLTPEARTAAIGVVTQKLTGQEGILAVIDPAHPEGADPALASAVALGFYPERSGDLAVLRADGWQWVGSGPIEPIIGTTHGSTDVRDTRVPLWLWGAGVKPGVAEGDSDIRAAAPTLGAILKLGAPKDAEVGPIEAALAP